MQKIDTFAKVLGEMKNDQVFTHTSRGTFILELFDHVIKSNQAQFLAFKSTVGRMRTLSEMKSKISLYAMTWWRTTPKHGANKLIEVFAT